MSLPMQVALTIGPLACYFYVVGVWQSGRHPRVVRGPVDFAVLAFGVSGLLTVGPVGQVLMNLIFGSPGPIAWGLWFLFLGLWATIFAALAARRLVVYNLDAPRLVEAVREAVACLPDAGFSPTLGGFESTKDHRALHVESVQSLRVGTVDARGRDPEALIGDLRPILAATLRSIEVRPTRVTWGLFALSWTTMVAPLAVFLMTEPKARAAVRALWLKVTGGA